MVAKGYNEKTPSISGRFYWFFAVLFKQIFGIVEVCLHRLEHIRKTLAVHKAMVDSYVQKHDAFAVFLAIFVPANSCARRGFVVVVGKRMRKRFHAYPRQTSDVIIVVIACVVVLIVKGRLRFFSSIILRVSL